MKTKRCTRCGLDKRIDDFTYLSSSKDGYSYYCRDCRQEQYLAAKARGVKGGYKKKELRVASMARAKAKQLGVENTLTNAEWSAILDKADGHCHYCGEYFGRDGLVLEHVVSQFYGGANSKENVVASCPACNRSKARMSGSQLAELRSRLNEAARGLVSSIRNSHDGQAAIDKFVLALKAATSISLRAEKHLRESLRLAIRDGNR